VWLAGYLVAGGDSVRVRVLALWLAWETTAYVRRALELEVGDYPVRLVLDLCPGFLTRDRELEEVEDIGVCALPPAARRRQCEAVGASSGGSVAPALADRVGRAAAAGLAGGALADPPPTADRRQRPAGEQQQPRQQHGAVGQRLEAMRPGSEAEGIEIYASTAGARLPAKGAEVQPGVRSSCSGAQGCLPVARLLLGALASGVAYERLVSRTTARSPTFPR
jgi:hypothetical protein